MRYKINRIRQYLGQNFFFELGDYRQTVFLAATGRSGSTWLQNLINYDGSYRIIFEPFHVQKIDCLREWHYRQYLRPDNREAKFLQPATAILSGKLKDEWSDQYNQKLLVRKRLIKDIRAHLFLYWIKQNFAEIPIILLLRHPCAVTHSKMKLDWQTYPNGFLEQEKLMADFLYPFKRELEETEDIFERHILMWCVQNYVPLKQFGEGQLFVTFYEQLCQNPEPELRRLLKFIGRPFSKEVFDVLHKPSSESRKDSVIFSGGDLINAWREHLSREQIGRAIEILQKFGLHQIYGEGSLPLVNGDEALKLM